MSKFINFFSWGRPLGSFISAYLFKGYRPKENHLSTVATHFQVSTSIGARRRFSKKNRFSDRISEIIKFSCPQTPPLKTAPGGIFSLLHFPQVNAP